VLGPSFRGSVRQQVLHVCLLVHALTIILGPSRVFDSIALYGPAVAQGEWWRTVSAGFAHAGLVHLVFNMFSLLVLGGLLEPVLRRVSPWHFPVLYFGSLLGGSLGALALEYDYTVVGASGAIFGLMGAAITVPRRMGHGWNAAGFAPWIVLNLVITFAVPTISRGGHLGGLLAGAALGWLLAPKPSSDPYETR
jgi:membrane associated rhomboid family serine protease